MKHLLRRLLALSVLSSLLTVANGAEDERWTGWCSYSEIAGETFPASRMILPGWACVKASRLKLHDTYKVKTTLNPFYLTGDFNGDGRQDIAVWVEHIKSRKVGVLIIHGGKVTHTAIGAGVDWDKRGEDYSWTDMWSIEPKGTVFQSPHEGDRRAVTRGDSLILTKSESAAFAVYWSGNRYRSYQLGD